MMFSVPSSSDTRSKKHVLLSVTDKKGLETFAPVLVEQYGYTLIATGGTYTYLQGLGLPVVELSAWTQAPEILDGRVKSLHPKVFGGLLADRTKALHLEQVHHELLDMVVVNLYPFEQALKDGKGDNPETMRELIDIGGVSLLRAAAKNWRHVAVVSDTQQYKKVLLGLEAGMGELPVKLKETLAAEAFARTAQYDHAIANYWLAQVGQETLGFTPAKVLETSEAVSTETETLTLHPCQSLRYGENPHQSAGVYTTSEAQGLGFDLLNGKPLSYNNLLDMQAGWNLVSEFTPAVYGGTSEVASLACVIIKHNTPCGVALSARTPQDAFQKALDADPVSAFGGIVCFNTEVNAETAKQLVAMFLEVIAAPAYTPEALDILATKKNLRVIRRDLALAFARPTKQYRQLTESLYLVQEDTSGGDLALLTPDALTVVTKTQPTQEQWQDLLFAWRIAKHVKSNAMVLAKDGCSIGIGGGQTSRIGALEIAIQHASGEVRDSVLASDGFLPAVDNIQAVAQNNIRAIIQPGGSIKDPDVIALADQYGIAMVTTGRREFLH
ncbi:MAG: bifunctional phosphoribosylaminoimidazolecarboxamide formyltransferase/IMP cyclohydrolase [Vampirovibrionales bacterium]